MRRRGGPYQDGLVLYHTDTGCQVNTFDSIVATVLLLLFVVFMMGMISKYFPESTLTHIFLLIFLSGYRQNISTLKRFENTLPVKVSGLRPFNKIKFDELLQKVLYQRIQEKAAYLKRTWKYDSDIEIELKKITRELQRRVADKHPLITAIGLFKTSDNEKSYDRALEIRFSANEDYLFFSDEDLQQFEDLHELTLKKFAEKPKPPPQKEKSYKELMNECAGDLLNNRKTHRETEKKLADDGYAGMELQRAMEDITNEVQRRIAERRR